jgi:predicted PurR-regulated permease PerM
LKSPEKKMTKPRKKGFILVLVIITIVLIGIMEIVLTEGAKTIVYQSNKAYLEADQRNLTASGLAWAKQNIKDKNQQTLNATIKLDVTAINIRDAALSIVIGPVQNNKVELEVNTSCSRGTQTLKHNGRYQEFCYESSGFGDNK